jgi:hypothetical protein
VELRLEARAEAAFAGDQLIAVVDPADDDGLEHPVLAERIGERGDLARVEALPRLERVRVDLIDGDVEQLSAVVGAGFEPAELATEQGVESAAESSVIHGR